MAMKGRAGWAGGKSCLGGGEAGKQAGATVQLSGRDEGLSVPCGGEGGSLVLLGPASGAAGQRGVLWAGLTDVALTLLPTQ